MRIASANIQTTVGKSNLTPATDRAQPRQQTIEAVRDSYSKNPARPQYIDAEYVEFYSPSVDVFNKERKALDNTLEFETATSGENKNSATNTSPALGKYLRKTHEAPPPGTFIDTFA